MKQSLKSFCVFASFVAGLIAFHASAAFGQAAWQPLECIPADLPPERLYEVTTVIDDFESATSKLTGASGGQQANVIITRDTAEHHGGAASARVDYEFGGKKELEYIELNGTAEFAQLGQAFGFWIKHDGTPFAIRLRILDKSGECHQIDMLGANKPGWQFVACSLDAVSAAWGGDGNKKKDYPCKLASICIDRPRPGFTAKGTLWIDDVAILRPAKQATPQLKVEVNNRRFGNLYTIGDTISLRTSGEGERLRWQVTDFFGRELKKGDGPASSTKIAFTLNQPGWFSCNLELISGDRVVNTHSFPCAALPADSGKTPSDFFGVCTHFGQNSYALDAMEMMKRYGIDQFRDEISWGSYETEKGHLAMPDFGAKYLKHAAELKMRPLLIYDYANRHYDDGAYPNSPEAIAAFTRFAVDLTAQTRGMVNMFEVWNEWVGGCGMEGRPGKHDGEAYGRLLQPTYTAVKKAFPDVKVVGIGGEYGAQCAENIMSAIRTAGTNMMDAWSIHPYRYPNSPELSDLVGEVSRIQTKVAGTGERSKAWVTEIGYPTHRGNGGSDEPTQARYLVRTLALLQSTRTVEKVFWYDLKDDGLTRGYNEDNFGLIHHQHFNCAPKPGIVAASVFIRMTSGAEFADLRRTNGVCIASYRRADGREVNVLWGEYGPRRVNVTGDLSGTSDLMGGNVMPMTPHVYEVTENPIYIAGRKLVVTLN